MKIYLELVRDPNNNSIVGIHQIAGEVREQPDGGYGQFVDANEFNDANSIVAQAPDMIMVAYLEEDEVCVIDTDGLELK